MNRLQTYLMTAIAVVGLAAGTLLWWFDALEPAHWIWSIATIPVLGSLFVQIVTSLRRGDVGLDVVAGLSMTAALVFGEPLAANVVALMYAGGQLLENFAEGRARSEMSALLGRLGRTAMRYSDGTLEEIPIADIEIGDRLLIRQGEVLPVDGHVTNSPATLDLSAITGESLPQSVSIGALALSGTNSVGTPFDLVAVKPAAQSTYAGIVRLIEAAQASKAPMVRLADRYAVGFLVFTIIIAAAAWFFSNDPVRALSVLVVATPCPLILAVPVAMISGLSRTARLGVLIKNGGALEALAKVQTAVLDKTGTLTHGHVDVVEILPANGFDANEVLRMAASLDQASGHVVAASLIEAAASRNLKLSLPDVVTETPGAGIEGRVDQRRVIVGGDGFVHRQLDDIDPGEHHQGIEPGALTVAVGVDGRLAGVIILKDMLRDDAAETVKALRDAGLSRIVLASGDRTEIAEEVVRYLGIDLVLGELGPAEKVAVLKQESGNGLVMMVGDGVNDGPALAAADVGVAMGARGAAASSEIAEVVVLVDQLKPLARAIVISKRTRAIALQSVVVGLGLSIVAMIFAALGYLPPVQGALLQEAIDVLVILNALRALR